MNEDKSPKKAIDLNKYQDPIDLSPKHLELGLYLATNQKKIYKILVIILGSLAAIFLLYSIYGYAYYFIFGIKQDKALQENTAGVDLVTYRQNNIPLDLEVGQAKAISNNAGTDFVVKIKNPNDKQAATFNFCFIKTDEKACATNFILPNEEKDVVIVNSNAKVASGPASFEIYDIAWQKIKAGEIPDWNTFKSQRINFLINDKKLITYNGSVNYLEFSITNNSSYGYFEVPLVITANLNGEAVAVNKYVIQGLNSQETKSVRLSWPETGSVNSEIIINPELNLLNNSIYRPYTSN